MVSRLQGILQPKIFRFKLGAFELTSILDGTVVRTGLHPKFGANHAVGEAATLARANRLDTDRFEHPFAPTLLDTGRQLLLFDTGNGQLRRGVGVGDFSALPDGHLCALLPGAGYQAADVDVVVLTHGHPDHIGGLMTDGQPTFPNARYVFGAAEFDFWRRGQNIRESRKINRELFMRLAVPLADRATFAKPGDEIVPGVHAVDGSGHSPGQLAFHIESEGRRLLLWADVVIHYVMSLQRPDWHVDVDDDKEQAVITRGRMLDMVATDGLWAIGYHMPFPGVGFVEKSNSGYRWVPATYQFNI
jgi:glyoxylase-like metal-dependent hydrolase (beta-lactamase superfamily II)